MAILKYSDLRSEVLPYLKADPSNPITDRAIKKAVIEFCNRSWVWKHMPDPQDVTVGESYYDLEYPQGSEISSVIGVALDGVPLDPKAIDWLDLNEPRWRTVQATPKYYTQVDTEQIILAYVPQYSVSGGLTMTLAVQPDQTSTSFPKWIGTQYWYVLVSGALANLMLMSNEDYSDDAKGAYHLGIFNAGIADARGDGVGALGRAVTRTGVAY